MQKEFEVSIDGQPAHFTARTGTDHDVGIFESGAATPCIVLNEHNGLERTLASLVDKEELLSLAILQTINDGLIERAREAGEQIHETLVFVPNPR